MMERRGVGERGLAVFALVWPAVFTWVYFVALSQAAAGVQQAAYAVGKLVQFVLPVLGVFVVARGTWGWGRPTRQELRRSLVWGAVTGGVILAATMIVYRAFSSSADFALLVTGLREKLAGVGISSLSQYVVLSLFYCVCHSGLEEYYWRWFVYRDLARTLPDVAANLLSAVGFMSHHVIVLAVYFGWGSPWTWLLSLAVAVGGVLWAWLYRRQRSIAGPWLSHLLVDAGIFYIGYQIGPFHGG